MKLAKPEHWYTAECAVRCADGTVIVLTFEYPTWEELVADFEKHDSCSKYCAIRITVAAKAHWLATG